MSLSHALLVFPTACPTDEFAHDKLLDHETEAGWWCRLPEQQCPYCQAGVCAQRLLIIWDASTHIIVHGTAGQA